MLASPYMRGGRVVDVPWLRVVFSRVANWFLARASGQHISTMTCMVRAIDGRFLRSLHLRSTGMDVMPEMIHKAKLLRASIEEVPAELNWQRQNRVGGTPPLEPAHLPADPRHDGLRIHPAAVHVPARAGPPAARVRRLREHLDGHPFHRRVRRARRRAPDTARDMSAAVALAYARYPHTFIVGLLSLMLAMQLIGMAMLSLQNKKYFDELFHLGSTLLRERREADLRRKT